MLSQELFRAMADDREREVQQEMRIRRLLTARRQSARWHFGRQQDSLGAPGSARSR
jgi:hypothetical protein